MGFPLPWIGGSGSLPSNPVWGSMAIIVMLELDELCLQICRRPEKGVAEEFAPNRADQVLHEGMRKRGIRSRLDFHHVKDSKISVPLMESVQRIMVRAEVFCAKPTRGLLVGTSGIAPLHRLRQLGCQNQ